MNRTLLLGILVFFAVVGIALMGEQPQAKAGHGCYGVSACGGCYGVSACDGCYGYRSPGFAHRHLMRGHYRGYRHGCFGWGGCYGATACYGYSGCYGYTGCYGYAGCGGCYGYAGCGGCYGCAGTVIQGDVIQKGDVMQKPSLGDPMPTPAAEETAEGAEAVEPPPEEPAAGDSAMMNVHVPQGATVVINDYTTNSTGAARKYVSRGLKGGRKYRFEVRAEVDRGGETLTQTKVVQLEATQVVDLVFDFDAARVASVSH